MQDEQPIAETSAPQIVPEGDSTPIKKQHGGKRAGAGRKPNLTKILLKGVSRETILAACENVDVGSVIIGLLRSKREQSRIEALHFIFDRVLGKPKQDGKAIRQFPYQTPLPTCSGTTADLQRW